MYNSNKIEQPIPNNNLHQGRQKLENLEPKQLDTQPNEMNDKKVYNTEGEFLPVFSLIKEPSE